MEKLTTRQVHLDFHTSADIEGIGRDFDAQAFARMAQSADVSSMTVFARCHHGMLYYESEAFKERVHPHLAHRSLLVDQVRALHDVGIRAPVYIAVQWDYYTAMHYPQWLIRKPDGAHESGPFFRPGFYQSLCVNTGYLDFLKAQTAEVMALLCNDLDGIFFDIVGIRPCWCHACRAEMKQRGIDMEDEAAVRGFAKLVMDRFKADMSAFVRERKPDATIFYNAGHVGPCTRVSRDAYSHFELESLPSGGWGYLHYPVSALYARGLGMDCMGMTGKFHTSWGDFHSLKNKAALEFEAFRMLSFGQACSIGDQLEPFGQLNPATYRLIGSVFSQIKAREAWSRPSSPLVEAALLTGECEDREHEIPPSIFGAVQVLQELGIQFDILDDSMPLDGYNLVMLSDDFVMTPAFGEKLAAYVQQGGRVLGMHHGALCEGAYPAFFGATYHGDTDAYPDFILAEGPLAKGLEMDNEYAMYQQGSAIVADGGEVVLQARAPFFKREGDRFCSHAYTPSAKGPLYPAAIRRGNALLFSHPLFSQYRHNAPLWVKQMLRNALDMLLPNRLVTHDGPSTVTVSLLDQPQHGRVCVHVLSYVPVRKSETIDIVEERTQVRDLTLRFSLPYGIESAKVVPEGQTLDVRDNAITIPVVDGYAIVELMVK